MNKLGDYLEMNPDTTIHNLEDEKYEGILKLTGNPINLLKEHFGISKNHFNHGGGRKMLPDSDWERRREEFRDFVGVTEGRFTLKDLKSELCNLINVKYGSKVYGAIFDVCRDGRTEYTPVDFIPFANYAVQIFLERFIICS